MNYQRRNDAIIGNVDKGSAVVIQDVKPNDNFVIKKLSNSWFWSNRNQAMINLKKIKHWKEKLLKDLK